MNREGRQHGMVRTYRILPSPLNHPVRTINVVHATPTAGIFEKVKSLQPTEHSKFTGKCGKARYSDCHLQASLKSKGPNDDVSRIKLVTWRVVDTRLGLGMSFVKSSKEDEENDVVEDGVEFEEMDGEDEIEIECEEERMDGGDGEGDEDETMSFCEVGYVWEQVEGDDDSWCLVAEM